MSTCTRFVLAMALVCTSICACAILILATLQSHSCFPPGIGGIYERHVAGYEKRPNYLFDKRSTCLVASGREGASGAASSRYFLNDASAPDLEPVSNSAWPS